MTLEAERAAAPTLEEVARVAGVSRSTVSRVVNGSPNVTADVIATVNRAIDELGYVPNRAARSLASRRTHAIALVIPENTAKFFADPYFASVIQGVALHLATTEYTLSLLIASETETEKTRRYLQGGNVDGALILSHHSDDQAYVQLSRRMPIVFGGRPMSGSDGTHYVDVDNVAAARSATEYLIGRGKTRIATISGPHDMASGLDRLQGWREALDAAGLAADLHEEGDFTPPSGEDAMRRLLERGEEFDGLFAASAQMASGALIALRKAGLRVPEDVGVVSIDNDYFAQNALPPLTTIDQPSVQQGSKMADVLLRLIEGEDVPYATIIPTSLVERTSV
ncbi:LacI family transcriptional regulator [Salinibacterium sp. dk2585]|uniref:LacI family DNA-binding transcriptional regulator n=1 Tax=unclassified Salinibacterium TaxID=2632331 RepID=UPI0011C24574|nr:MULTISPECIES: LacI family DNA-binding transcriptional regulator [unclassified Salinibacterium]QEE62411.1 LacI family transcriptional regulator [Salinibacterium sp. dk2585]TXK52706.1 LacI family transcriptional regulator [Salinibacterium sp. dk5596]